MKLGVILVEPLYSENVGLTARLLKNFEASKLYLISPKCSHLNDAALSRAMHGKDVLKEAMVLQSIEEAKKHFDLLAATTAKLSKESKHFRKALSLKQFRELYGESNARVGLMLGREDKGLTNDEIMQADLVLSIKAGRKYNTLNITHALAIMLYELASSKKQFFKTAGSKTREQTLRLANEVIDETRGIKNRQAVKNSFRQLISKTLLTEKELKSLMGLFSRISRAVRKKP